MAIVEIDSTNEAQNNVLFGNNLDYPCQLCNNQSAMQFMRNLTDSQLSTFVFKMACIFSDDLDWDARKFEIDKMNIFINAVYKEQRINHERNQHIPRITRLYRRYYV